MGCSDVTVIITMVMLSSLCCGATLRLYHDGPQNTVWSGKVYFCCLSEGKSPGSCSWKHNNVHDHYLTNRVIRACPTLWRWNSWHRLLTSLSFYVYSVHICLTQACQFSGGHHARLGKAFAFLLSMFLWWIFPSGISLRIKKGQSRSVASEIWVSAVELLSSIWYCWWSEFGLQVPENQQLEWRWWSESSSYLQKHRYKMFRVWMLLWPVSKISAKFLKKFWIDFHESWGRGLPW